MGNDRYLGEPVHTPSHEETNAQEARAMAARVEGWKTDPSKCDADHRDLGWLQSEAAWCKANHQNNLDWFAEETRKCLSNENRCLGAFKETRRVAAGLGETADNDPKQGEVRMVGFPLLDKIRRGQYIAARNAARYTRRWELWEEGATIAGEHVNKVQAEKQAAEFRATMKRHQTRVEKVRRKYIKAAKDYPQLLPKEAARLLANPETIPPSYLNSDFGQLFFGKKLKDYPVMRRWLLENGVEVPEFPKIKLPHGKLTLMMERILGRPLHKLEKLTRDSEWRNMELKFRRDDAREAIRLAQEL